MVTFAGVDHVSFTVSDLDASQRFYTEVLNFSHGAGPRVRLDLQASRHWIHAVADEA
jgi:catechol 2,3-dioxygenase-like lactoylglutathione lyase family enzyme